MKAAGLLLMPAGWAIALSALVVLAPAQEIARTGFVLAGVCVEGLGLALAARAHILPRGSRE